MCVCAKPSASSREDGWFQRWMKEVWCFLQNSPSPCKKQTTCLLTYLSVELLCSHSAKNYNYFFPWQPICCCLFEMEQLPRGLDQCCSWPRGRGRLCFGGQGTGSRVKWNEVLVWTIYSFSHLPPWYICSFQPLPHVKQLFLLWMDRCKGRNGETFHVLEWISPKLLKPTSRFTFCLMAFELGLVLLRQFHLQDTGFLCGWSLYWGVFCTDRCVLWDCNYIVC